MKFVCTILARKTSHRRSPVVLCDLNFSFGWRRARNKSNQVHEFYMFRNHDKRHEIERTESKERAGLWHFQRMFGKKVSLSSEWVNRKSNLWQRWIVYRAAGACSKRPLRKILCSFVNRPSERREGIFMSDSPVPRKINEQSPDRDLIASAQYQVENKTSRFLNLVYNWTVMDSTGRACVCVIPSVCSI